MKNAITFLLLFVGSAAIAQVTVPNTNGDLVYPVEIVTHEKDDTNYEVFPVERFEPNAPKDTVNYELLMPYRVPPKDTVRKKYYWESFEPTDSVGVIDSGFDQF